MDKQDFYARLSEVVKRPLTALEVKLLDIACDPEDLEGLKRGVDGGWIKSLKGKVPEFIPLQDAEARLSEGQVNYWLYDRKTQVWLINIAKGHHEHLAGILYGIFTDTDSVCATETNAEKYIEEHYGFFVSGALNMYIPIKDDGCVLTAEEQVFNQAKGSLKWRGI